jgi:hypothetical protein
MKLAKYLILFSVLLGGCIPSLHRLYTDKDVVYDPNLVGTWKDPNSADIWEFCPAEPNSYLMIYTDQNKNAAKFTVHLVKLDKMLFLDIFPKEANQPSNDFYKLHFYPVHTFAKVNQISPTLNMQFMDINKFTRRLAKNPMLLQHEVIEHHADNYPKIVITASTAELQDFMRKHAQDEDVFAKEITMNRVISRQAKPPAEPNEAKK